MTGVSVDLDIMALLIGLALNVIVIAGIVTRSNVRLENRLTRVETSVAFILQMMKVNVATHHERED